MSLETRFDGFEDEGDMVECDDNDFAECEGGMRILLWNLLDK